MSYQRTLGTPGNGTFVPQASTPPDHTVTPVYVDTSASPVVVRQWDGSAWQPLLTQSQAVGAAAGMALVFGA